MYNNCTYLSLHIPVWTVVVQQNSDLIAWLVTHFLRISTPLSSSQNATLNSATYHKIPQEIGGTVLPPLFSLPLTLPTLLTGEYILKWKQHLHLEVITTIVEYFFYSGMLKRGIGFCQLTYCNWSECGGVSSLGSLLYLYWAWKTVNHKTKIGNSNKAVILIHI